MRKFLLSIMASWLVAVVSPAGAATAPANAVSARLLVSNPAPYVGEEVDLTFEVRYRRYPGGRPSLTWPKDDLFLASDPALSRSSRQRTADGVIIETLQRRLQPLQPGPLHLQGARLTFGRVDIPVSPVTLQIRPLPQQQRPAGFSGLVGHYRLQLDAGDSGARDIIISVTDEGQVGTLPLPRIDIGPDDRLVPLDRDTAPSAGGGRRHRWRYHYLPAGNAPERLQVSLVTFDPETGRYEQLQAGTTRPISGQTGGNRLLPLTLGVIVIVTAAASFLLWRRPRRVEECLSRLLGCAPHELSRREITAALGERLDPQTQVLLQAWWRQNDRRWSPETAAEQHSDSRELRIRLRKIIDKKNRIPYRDRT